MMSEFTIDPRIAADSLFLIPLELSDLRLMNDARYPWLLLVPRVEATEIVDLGRADRTRLLDEIAEVATALRTATGCHKLNIAALGNVVRQLHVHIVARFTTDAAWPKPVWGSGEAVAYEPQERDKLIAKILAAALPG
jgi:diadenosine tetraphosphate (Ap4A) HIT family hydrolase